MSELLTTGQAAALLGVSKPTLVRAVQRGQLRPALVTPGLHRRFRREELMAFRHSHLAHTPEDLATPELRAS
jgi:excisionase family DNA binding protein